jgi:hypothetical protein
MRAQRASENRSTGSAFVEAVEKAGVDLGGK